MTRTERAINLLLKHKLVALESDTIMGISCLINSLTIAKLVRLKQRDYTKPFIIVGKHVEHFLPYVDFDQITEAQFALLNACQIKPTTFVVPAKDTYLNSQGSRTVAIRLIRSGILAEVTEALNQPIISTSINVAGKKPIQDLHRISTSFPELDLCGPYNLEALSDMPSRIIDLLTQKILRA